MLRVTEFRLREISYRRYPGGYKILAAESDFEIGRADKQGGRFHFEHTASDRIFSTRTMAEGLEIMAQLDLANALQNEARRYFHYADTAIATA